MDQSTEFKTQQILELACSAQRILKDYIKTIEPVYDDKMELRYYKQPNKICMLYAVGAFKVSLETDPRTIPTTLDVTDEDRQQADTILKYYKRLMFDAVAGDNEFKIKVNSILSSESVATNDFGFVACLPAVFKRDVAINQVAKQSRKVDDAYVGEVGANILDKDCEIIGCQRSKNFDAYNIDAIIDNKMVSWMSKFEPKLGPCVLVKAKVKDHNKHWKHGNSVTRLNYVKVAQ